MFTIYVIITIIFHIGYLQDFELKQRETQLCLNKMSVAVKSSDIAKKTVQI